MVHFMMNPKLFTLSTLILFIFALTLSGYPSCSWADINNDLLLASRSGNLNEVSRLLSSGANVNARDKNGMTALHAAASYGFNSAIAYQANAQTSAKYKAIVELLIKKGANVNATGIGLLEGMTPLHAAAGYGFKDAAELLINNGADVNAKDHMGETPIQYASMSGNKNVLELLISKDPNINEKDEYGWTPLLNATSKGRLSDVELLLANGADVNAKRNDGWTALHLAAKYGMDVKVGDYEDIAVLLISAGADVNAKNDEGKTPFDVASLQGQKRFAALLAPVSYVPRPSFDCGNIHALTYLESEICSFPPLTDLDRKLNEAYLAALKVVHNPQNVKDEQREWLRERNKKCKTHSHECSMMDLMDMYNLQIVRLSKVASDPGSNDSKDTCIELADLADRSEIQALTIKGVGSLTDEERAQLNKLNDGTYHNPSAIYQLPLNPNNPPERFAQFSTGGTCPSTQIFNLRSIISSNGQSTGWIDVNDPGEIIRWAYWGGGDYPIRYKDHYFMVTADLSDANGINMISSIKPDGTILPLCTVENASFEYVVSSGSESLCMNIAKGIIKPIKWQEVNDIHVSMSREEFVRNFDNYADTVQAVRIDLNGDGTLENIGRLTYDSGAGCGSGNIWGRELSPNFRNVVKGNLNDVVSSFGPPFEIYEIDKKYYIRTGNAKDKEAIVQIRGSKVEQVCELQKKTHFKPKVMFEQKN